MDKVVRNAALAVFSALMAGAWLLTPAFKAQAKSGQPTFDAKCAMCHAKDGSGNSPMEEHESSGPALEGCAV